jgi:uncharacterized membrane protein YraQ (UPF0718 family)
VVPLTVELRRKGASQPAALSFLTTTPESSVDSILLTWGLMGPVFAIARPLAALLTALVAGASAMAWLPEKGGAPPAADRSCCADGCEEPVDRGVRRGFWRRLLRPSLRYGFVELLDDLAFWMVVGLLVGGVLTALLPPDLATLGLGGGLAPMLLALAAGVPLYLCASASTPIAAALLAKGIGPGAALVFLLAGPATNAAALVLLGRTFGGKFLRVYLASVVGTALFSGVVLEMLTASAPIPAFQAASFEELGAGPVHLLATVALAVLLGWRLSRGALQRGLREVRSAFRSAPTTP